MPSSKARLPLLLSVMAAAAMVGLTTWQIYGLWTYEQNADSRPAEQAGTDTVQQSLQPPQVNLASVDLFGQAGQEAGADQTDTENLPETNLRLHLRGVLAASGDFPGSALIEDADNNTEVYLVGDELPGNATLRVVRANRVIIERGGKLENLYFPDDDDRSGLTMTADQQQEASPVPQPATQQPQPRTTAGPSNEQQRREEIRQRLEQLRERLRSNSN